MTAIAVRDGVMAADSATWAAGATVMFAPSRPKIIRLGGGLVGCGGSSDEIDLVREWMIRGGDKPRLEKGEGFEILWARADRTVWHAGYRLNFYQIHAPFSCIGCSTQFMYGALFQGASAEQAVRLAILHTDGAGGDVQVERIEG
jgi:hypothetical protein